MKATDGDGIGCIIDASGVPSAVNNCFSMLRYVPIYRTPLDIPYMYMTLYSYRKGGKVVLIGLLKVRRACTINVILLSMVGATTCGESTTKYCVQVDYIEDSSRSKDIPFLGGI